jgi:hypothetical protein
MANNTAITPEVVMRAACTNVQHALRNGIGMLNAEVYYRGEADGIFEFEIRPTIGYMRQFFVQQQERTYATATLLRSREHKRMAWVSHAIVQKDGGRWDPPYEEEEEVAESPTVEGALIESVLVYFRNAMYDCQPYIEPNINIDKEGDVPQ